MVMYEQCHRLQRFLITHSERMMCLSLSNTPKTTEIGTLLIRPTPSFIACLSWNLSLNRYGCSYPRQIVSLRLNLACLVLLTLTLAENQISGFFRHQHAQEHHWQ
ncbi:hypothetical protein L5515_018715 [Caenorhabditis briggsae]|uniref:Uncharacterized protein n=1 Tax=Caenorhabditis briggsae TaxID=6238 RepID=A0AAE9FHY2_CAEBR|nr:hypothetical protein L5515_018715 [Caenorhabditis briggsae]